MMGIALASIGSVPTIPASAWEQAVFVCLFLIAIGIILSWQSKQNDKNQSFMERMNTSWQNFLEKHESKSDKALERVVDSINCLTDKIEDHDAHVDARVKAIRDAAILEASSKTQPLPKPRNTNQ